MADYSWTGAVSNDWTVAGNWDPAGPPADGDSVFLNRAPTTALAGGDRLATELVRFVITPTYDKATIGDPATDLQIDADYVELDLNADTASYLRIGETGSVCSKCVIVGGENTNAVQIGKTAAGSIITDLFIHGGNVHLTQGTVTRQYQYGTPTVTIATGWAYTHLYHGGGTSDQAAQINGATTFALVSGGELTISDGDQYRIVALGGGKILWEAQGHTLTYADALSGTIDASGDDRAKTITWPTLGPSGTLNIANGAYNIVLTNPLVHGGGTFVVDQGRRVSLP